MSNKKAFTLIEITVVIIIVGILACIAIGAYLSILKQQAAVAAEHNLITIYNAQKNYYFSPTGSGTYCIASCDTTPDINLPANLNLNITDNYFSYQCVTDASGFKCTATNIATPTFILTVTNTPIILPGGTGCTSGGPAPCNPICTPAGNSNCPSS